MSGAELAAHLLALAQSGSLGPLLVWWAALLTFGLLFLPVSQRLFPGSVDGGLAAGKLLGLLMAAGAAWMTGFASPGGLSSLGVTMGLLVVGAGCVLGLGRRRAVPPPSRRAIAVSELGFLVALLFCSVVRSLEPALATTEKFMDFGFVQAILHAQTLPPPDPWYAGKPINYYYFGHFVTAFLIRLTGVPASVGYNLMVATVFAATATAAGTLAFDAVRLGAPRRSLPRGAAALAALASASLLVAAGNLHPVVHGGRPGYHYAEATRFVGFSPPTDDKLITEFPAYSFLVADLHAHLLHLPFVVAFLHVLLRLVREVGEVGRRTWLPPGPLAAAGGLLGTAWMTNSWDAPVLAGLLALALWIRPPPADRAAAAARLGAAALGTTAAVAMGATLSLPFTLFFEPFGRGLALVETRTPSGALILLYGWQAAVALLYVTVALRGRALEAVDRWLLVLLSGALGCIVTHEIVYVIDGLPSDHRRANTVFKLGYMAFVLLTVAVGPMVIRIVGSLPAARNRVVMAALLLALCLPPMVYLPRALPALAASPLRDRATLDGLAQTFARNPEDAAMADWLGRERRDGRHLMEIDGPSFGYAGRMAVFTGIPTVLGWSSHEHLWRPEEPVGLRRRDIRAVYTSGDPALVAEVLDRYDVGFVVVGELERLRLPALDEAPLRALGEVAFEAGTSRVYRIPTRGAP